ncbi:MAG: DUF2314 domain-containing protein [Thermoanaerobaculia bacterium]|nr:DUF2314 domain-containing protein [Thermoanaerobaculia bacterium]
MKRVLSLLVVAFLATSCKDGPSNVVKRPGRPDVVNVEAEDPLMSAAIKKAGSTLTEFKAALRAPPTGASGFSVKVSFPHGNNSREHIWLGAPSFSDGQVSGVVGNEPVYVTSLKLGQQVSAPEARVSDWMYVQNGVLHGGFTVRALLDRMPREERERQLAEMNFRLE